MVEVVTDPLKAIVGLDADIYVHITRGCSTLPCAPLLVEPQPRACLNTLRHFDSKVAFASNPPLPIAAGTGVTNLVARPCTLTALNNGHHRPEQSLACGLESSVTVALRTRDCSMTGL